MHRRASTACWRSLPPRLHHPPTIPRFSSPLPAPQAGKDCLLALVDATYATDGQDAQGRQALDQLKGTLTKCE